MPVAELRGLLECLPDRVVVLLDEALREFADAEERDAALALAEEFPRLIVVRTFSKAWGLAGLRVGYAIGGEGAQPVLARLEPDLGVNELGHAGALEALRHARGVVAERIRTVAGERARLARELVELGVDVAPSQANFVWLAVEGVGGAELARRLERHAVLVAPGGPLGDPARVRAAVQRPGAGDRLLRALRAELGSPGS
jgi:histidinol-phosphate aminotransferase